MTSVFHTSLIRLSSLLRTKLFLPNQSITMSWCCSKCTFLNPPSQKSTCQICLSSSSAPPSLSTTTTSSSSKWSCSACTFANTYDKSHCEICSTRATASMLSSFEELEPIVSSNDLDSSIGSVFFPLKSCSNKRKHQDTSDEGTDGFRELGKARDAKSSRKPEALLDSRNEDTSFEVSDGFCELGKSTDVKFSRKVEGLLGSKNEETPSEASDGFRELTKSRNTTLSKKANVLLGSKNEETSSEASDGFRELSKSRNATLSKKAEVLLDDPIPDTGSSQLKILTYNVWFREDLELYKRMEVIGDLIQQHSPDFICFQEVTPNIYRIFQQSKWWKVYYCSVTPQMSSTRPYFCMQLSKVPVKTFSCKPFSNSAMGRELCMTKVEVEKGKPLVVATSHLESPCPAPPKWDQMYSKERVAQAKETVNFLKDSPNVIFAGDMNWNDKLDGKFPLPDGWVDAWSEARPGDAGFTYDTKSNKMLSGNRTLQQRLDRFLCNLRDFEIRCIDMIGMEAIPGLSHCKEKKVKSEVKKLMLPVLPSDHYGLLLTIHKK